MNDTKNNTQTELKLAHWQRIFVNRTLNMGNIKSIGFDLDHTLAPYVRESFEALAFKETIKKFLNAGYPEELKKLRFNPNFVIRGLLVDIDRGNIMKVDGHKYVKIAFHGRNRLNRDERHKLYNSASFNAYECLSIDTLFALSEVQLFVEIVDYMDKNPGKIKKSYREVYKDLRYFIDLSHQDGTIKTRVIAEPDKFIDKDKFLQTAFIRLIDSGKKLFLLTNSDYSYSEQIMQYLFDTPSDDFPSWHDYFEYILVGAGKPGFYSGSQPFFEVMKETGYLKTHAGPLKQGRIYHGGNATLFQNLTGYHGDQILYVGDHIHGDIIRSKGSVNWRTMMIIPELDTELPMLMQLKPELDIINEKLNALEQLDEKIQILRSKISANSRQAVRAEEKKESKKTQKILKSNEKASQELTEKEAELVALDEEIKNLIQERQAKIHRVWGELMKAGIEQSRFANQVCEYACLYSSKVSNMRFYSSNKNFLSPSDILPHDL